MTRMLTRALRNEKNFGEISPPLNTSAGRKRANEAVAGVGRAAAQLYWPPGERLRKPTAKTPAAAAGAPAQDQDALTRYRAKRDPLSTNEPFGAEHKQAARETRTGRFVVHLHDATRPHYDVRLQIGGTLKSFAVPRGSSWTASSCMAASRWSPQVGAKRSIRATRRPTSGC